MAHIKQYPYILCINVCCDLIQTAKQTINFTLLFQPIQSYSGNGQCELPRVVKLQLRNVEMVAKPTGFHSRKNCLQNCEILKLLVVCFKTDERIVILCLLSIPRGCSQPLTCRIKFPIPNLLIPTSELKPNKMPIFSAVFALHYIPNRCKATIPRCFQNSSL